MKHHMANNLFQPIAANEKLRLHLDDIYACLDDCLKRFRVEDAFEEVSDALCKEMDVLLEQLGVLEEQYQEELPLEAEEPRGVEWMKDCDRMASFKQEFQTHSFSRNRMAVSALTKKLDIAHEVMERIDAQLYPEADPDIYTSYSKRELMDYVLNRWNKPSRELRNQLASAPSTHQAEYFQEKLDGVLAELHAIPGYFINEDSTIIYHEGLGRHLWQLRHSDDFDHTMDEVLRLVKTAEYFSGRMHRKFIYLDRETSPEEEQNEQVRLDRLVQETLQNQLSMATMRLGFCKAYFAKDFSEGFVGKMLYELIKSEHSAKVCDKMSNRKIQKFIHQVAGVLKKCGAFQDCSHGEIVSAIGFNKPAAASRIDYIRKGVDDVPEIQRWLESYIANYRAALKTQAELSANGER